MQFITKNSPLIALEISYANKLISKVYDTKFLRIYVDSTPSWKHHVKRVTHKLSVAHYGLRTVKSFISQETLKIVYYACFDSIKNYGLIFWGKSSYRANMFKIQKNIIRIITGCRIRDSYRGLLKNLKILPLQSRCILSFSYLCLTTKIHSN